MRIVLAMLVICPPKLEYHSWIVYDRQLEQLLTLRRFNFYKASLMLRPILFKLGTIFDNYSMTRLFYSRYTLLGLFF